MLGNRVGLRHVGGGIGDRNAEIRADGLLGGLDLLWLAEPVEDNGRTGGREGAGDAKPDPAG